MIGNQKKLTIIVSIALLLLCMIFLLFFLLFNLNTKTKLEFLIKVNEKMHKSFEYGQGLPGYPTLEETMEFGNGHCGLYTTYFTEEIKKAGYKAVIWDIKSGLDANPDNLLIHSIVEVNINDKIYTFDPTLGIYYKKSLSQLTNSNSDQYIGKIDNNKLTIYSTPYFWSNISSTINHNNLNYYQDNKLQNGEFSINSNSTFFTRPNDFNSCIDDFIIDNYCATEVQNNNVILNINFMASTPLQRFYFIWYDDKNYPRTIKIFDNQNNTMILNITNYRNTTGTLNQWLNSEIKTNSIKIVFDDFAGQNRLLLRKIGVY